MIVSTRVEEIKGQLDDMAAELSGDGPLGTLAKERWTMFHEEVIDRIETVRSMMNWLDDRKKVK